MWGQDERFSVPHPWASNHGNCFITKKMPAQSRVAVDILRRSSAFFSCLSAENSRSGRLYIVSHHIDCLTITRSQYSQQTAVGDYLHPKNCLAPGEARTHGLQIMRLTRCLLRYGGLVFVLVFRAKIPICKYNGDKNFVPTGGLEPPIFGLGDRRLIH